MKKKNLPDKRSLGLHRMMQQDSGNHKVWVQFNEAKTQREAREMPLTNTSSMANCDLKDNNMLVHGSFTVNNNFMSAVN